KNKRINLSWKEIFYKGFSELIYPLIFNISPPYDFSPPVILSPKFKKIELNHIFNEDI
ncbi:unnamed protein product, partial [marine sediment metagenome]